MELQSSVKEPILVYCHVQSVTSNVSEICLNVKDKNTVVLHPDGTKNVKDEHYFFSQVFDSKTTQKTLFDHIALPMIKDLLRGRNGVLFMHGVLFSNEILVRCIEVIFNSIRNLQTPDCVGEPDQIRRYKLYPSLHISNGYSNEIDYIQEIESRKKSGQSICGMQIQDSTTVQACKHKNYSVLVSNVDIYKNYIYDLLENSPNSQKLSKTLQEDHTGHIYVSGAIEKQVITAEEALREFEKGQINRKNLLKNLKTESSCYSQTVFVIKVLHTRLNTGADKVSQEKRKFSQLCIVYLDRDKDVPQNRISHQNFQNNGHAYKAVSALQKCFEAYRESLSSSMIKVIPYNDSKLTQLFQSHFKGDGKIRILIFVSPVVENYISTLEAMNFAERNQDKSSVSFSSAVLSVGSKFSSQIHTSRREYEHKWKYLTHVSGELTPAINISSSSKILMEDELKLNALEESLTTKMSKHRNLTQKLMDLQENFRKNLQIIENENVRYKQENAVLLQDVKGREYQVQTLEQKLFLAEQTIENLNRQNLGFQQLAEKAKMELDYKTKQLIDQSHEIEEAKRKMHEKFVQEKNKLKKTMEKRYAAVKTELKRKLCLTDEKLKQLQEFLNADDLDTSGSINMFFVPSTTSFESSFSSVTESKRKDSLYGNSITYTKFMKLQSVSEFPQEGKKNKMKFNNDCYSGSGIDASKSSGMCSTQAEFFDKSLNLCSESASCISRKEQQSVPRLEEKLPSICPESERKSETSVCGSKLNDALPAKQQNISVFSVKKETFSNPASSNKTEVKEISNLPFVYRMKSEQPKQSKLNKGGVIENIKDKRNEFNGQELWIEHKPLGNLQINAALEPKIEKKMSVWRLKFKDLIKGTASKYILQHQELDSNGEIETQIYKGDIIKSLSGGAQVIFTDVEKVCLVSSFNDSYLKKRSGESIPLNEIEERCKISLECHGYKTKRTCKSSKQYFCNYVI
ncbi:kinesin-like protein KIF23 isoform X3 [Parasteatoda tepidariorum]|uniref:kinesin-like protein KIF23 isoform X3 n=1 Tax=Parasteatoda tepidariorum TaxID=114398 RepID=UPI0039BD4DB6